MPHISRLRALGAHRDEAVAVDDFGHEGHARRAGDGAVVGLLVPAGGEHSVGVTLRHLGGLQLELCHQREQRL